MAITGQGILPSGAIGNELIAVTRRAFIPKLIVQIYNATPTLSAFMAQAEPISGGVSPITVPVQGSAMVTTQATDYSGSFNQPTVVNGIQNAEFNLRAIVTPIPFYVMEGLAQVDAAVIPLIEARMNDAGNSITDYLSTKLWAASASQLDIWSIPDVISTSDPARGSYGGIARASNSFWQGNAKTIASITGASTSITRNNLLACVVSATKAAGGEMPSFGVLGPGTWAALSQDYIGSERYLITPEKSFDESTTGARAAFTALGVAGVPFYIDPAATENQAVLFNVQYIGFKIHSDAAFAVAGPESLLPNFQLGYIMVLVTLVEFVCTKPKSQTLITSFTGALTGV